MKIYQLAKCNEFLDSCQQILQQEIPPKTINGSELELKYLIFRGNLCRKENLGKLEEAIIWGEKAKDLCITLFGTKNEQFAKICVLLAEFYCEIDRFKQVDEYCNLATSVLLQLPFKMEYGLDHELITRKLLTNCCLSEFNLDKFFKILKEFAELTLKYVKSSFSTIILNVCKFKEQFQIKEITLQMLQLVGLSFGKDFRAELRTFEEIKREKEIKYRIEFCKWNAFISILLSDYAAGEQALKYIIYFSEDYYGVFHILNAIYYQRLAGFAWRFQKNNQEAQNYFKKSFDLKEKICKENAYELGDLYFEYADFLKYGENNSEEAEKYYEKAIAVFSDSNEEVLQMIIDSMEGNIHNNAAIANAICKLFK